MKRSGLLLIVSIGITFLTALAQQAPSQLFNETLLNGLTYRNLGPYRAGAWTVAVAIPETPAKAHRSIIDQLGSLSRGETGVDRWGGSRRLAAIPGWDLESGCAGADVLAWETEAVVLPGPAAAALTLAEVRSCEPDSRGLDLSGRAGGGAGVPCSALSGGQFHKAVAETLARGSQYLWRLGLVQ